MLPELIVRFVIEAFDGRFLDRAVYPLDLIVGPEVFHLCQTMLDSVLVADPVEDVVKSVLMARLIGKLDPVVG